jgi:hypothetical protein
MALLGGRGTGVLLVEGRDEVEQGAGRDGVVHGQGELGFPAGGYALHAVGHRVHLLQQPTALVQEGPARVSELGVARAPVEEQHVQSVLELAHAVGQRRRHLAQLACGRGEAAGAGDGVHHDQGVGCEDEMAVGHGGQGAFKEFE